MTRKPKSHVIFEKSKREPSLLDQLSAPLRDFVKDFQTHGPSTLEQVRERSPEKYIELSTRLVALIATLKPEPNGFRQAKSMEEVGTKLLQSVGCAEDIINGEMIADALKANDVFIEQLVAIRDAGQGPMQ
jgi:hypothetical protein